MRELIDPESPRALIAVAACGVLTAAREDPELMRAFAQRTGLTEDQALAITITEAVLMAMPHLDDPIAGPPWGGLGR